MNTTSEERKEARYQRRKAARQAKRDALSEACGNFEEVFTFEHLYDSAKNCSKGVMWKNSVQNYMSRITTNVADTHEKLMNGKFKSRGFHEFDLIERGKLRHIKSVHISERVVQRCLCDYILVKYEKFLEEHDMTNGEIDIVYGIIKKSYEHRMENHTFIEDNHGL